MELKMSSAHKLSQFSGSHLERVSARLATTMARSPMVVKKAPVLAPLQQGRNIFTIDVNRFNEHVAFSPSATWQGHFDCAMWLRTPRGINKPVQLVLRYVDAQGEKTLFVDRCAASGLRTVLLNGTVLLRVSGKVREGGFFLMDDNDAGDVIHEDAHFQPQYRKVIPVK